MPSHEDFTYVLPVEAFDASLLPPHARQPGTDAFAEEVSKYIQKDFEVFSGSAQIVVDASTIRVSWHSDPNSPSPIQMIVKRLERGEYKEAIGALEHLRRFQPDNPDVLYNLGMALSDTGKLEEAETHLRHVVRILPSHVNALVGLGVALVRQRLHDEAIDILEHAVSLDPKNPWAHRNLGGCLAKVGRMVEAETHLRHAAELNPSDQQAVIGLGKALEALDRLKEADEQYTKAIRLNPHSPLADIARDASSNMAQTSFRKAMPGGVRPDAVMYLLGGLQKFEKMDRGEIQKVAFEIAVLGQRGLDPNDSAQKYQLKSLPGDFSALHLLCLMFLGFRKISPETSIGFDLSKEFEVAKAMHKPESEI